MKNYGKINLWDFPEDKIFVRLKNNLRIKLIDVFLNKFLNEHCAIEYINEKSTSYGSKKHYSRGTFFAWKRGKAVSKGEDKTKNIPLWVLIEISKLLSKSANPNNTTMHLISRNIEYYCSRGGANRIYDPKLPVLVTPEFVSIMFHFCGDGHLALKKSVSSSYRQLNEDTLRLVYSKLQNCFGDFKLSLDVGKLYIPRYISNIYVNYYNIVKNKWNNSRIPKRIMVLSKKHLLAGLISFMIDEANIADAIEIYSKNFGLLNDIRNIAIKCGYGCRDIRKKFKNNELDVYRFLISSNSYIKLNEDIQELMKEYPTCGMAHKTGKFLALVNRKVENCNKTPDGITKNEILKLLEKSKTISELSETLILSYSTVREHLWDLEKQRKIYRFDNKGRNILWLKVR